MIKHKSVADNTTDLQSLVICCCIINFIVETSDQHLVSLTTVSTGDAIVILDVANSVE